MNHQNRQESAASKIAMNALCITLVFVGTRVLQFPIPLGYAHLGNAMILLVSVYYGPKTGALQIPGLSAEGVVGIVLFYVLGAALEKTKVLSYAG